MKNKFLKILSIFALVLQLHHAQTKTMHQTKIFQMLIYQILHQIPRKNYQSTN